jgi:diguanylate cyclase (GGDEF)-like protein
MRGIGVVLLVGGWLAAAVHEFPGVNFALTTAIFAFLGIYAFATAARGRRISVNMERKLRIGLLVHNMELANMAMQDDLTQLFNRRYFFERLERELQTARGFERPLAVMVIDLNCMKAVNDTYGHAMGDRLLAAFGRFLLERTRGSDVPARVGGDEFAVLLPDTSEQAAQVLLGRLIQRLAETNLVEEDDVTLQVSASFGLSGFPWGGSSVDAILQSADANLYADKHERKNGADPATAGANGKNAKPARRTTSP